MEKRFLLIALNKMNGKYYYQKRMVPKQFFTLNMNSLNDFFKPKKIIKLNLLALKHFWFSSIFFMFSSFHFPDTLFSTVIYTKQRIFFSSF